MNALPKIAQKMTRYLFGIALFTGLVLPLAVLETIEVFRRSGGVPREGVRNVARLAAEVDRLVCLYELAQVRERLADVKDEACNLRDMYLSRLRANPERVVVPFERLVSKAIMLLRPLAERRRIDLRQKGIVPDCQVRVAEADAIRAIKCLLTNAIKYSWTLNADRGRAWVDIRTGTEGGSVYVTIENWGMRIPSRDIETVFGFLIRGREASERSRTGTGVGLWDARQVARAHGGDVRLSSRPAKDEYDDSGPHIISSTFSLPVVDPAREREDS